MDLKDFRPIEEFPGYYISREGVVVRLYYTTVNIHVGTIYRDKWRFVSLNVNGKSKNIGYRRVLEDNPVPSRKEFIQIKGYPEYYINKEGVIIRKNIIVLKATSVRSGNGKYYNRVRFETEGGRIIRSLTKLITDTFAHSDITDRLVNSEIAPLDGFDGYFIDKKRNIVDGLNQRVKTHNYNGFVCVRLKSGKKTIHRSLEKITRNDMGDTLPIRECPDYSIDKKGDIYNKYGKKLKVSKMERSGCALVTLYEFANGKRSRRIRSVGKLIAEYLVPNPFGYTHFQYKDGDPFNAVVENIEWISDEAWGDKQSTLLKQAFTKTRQYAIDHCECPILKEYYRTGDKEILNDLITEIDAEMKTRISYWDTAKWAVFEVVMDRIERYAILSPLTKYIQGISRYYKEGFAIRAKDKTVEFTEFKSKKEVKKRITVDDLEYADAL